MSWFAKPYPSQINLRRDFSWLLLVSLFIAVFFILFKPWGVGALKGDLLYKLAFGFAMANASAMILVMALKWMFRNSFTNPDLWTVGKEIFSIAFLFILISIFTFFVNASLLDHEVSFKSWAWIAFYVIALGTIPVGFSILINYNKQLRINIKKAENINRNIEGDHYSTKSVALSLKGNNKGEVYEYSSEQLLYIESVKNYIKIHAFDKQGKPQVNQIRQTIKGVESQLDKHPFMLRCHRAYIVNFNLIVHVEGNSRGCVLHFNDSDLQVPVSRNYVHLFQSS